MPSTGCNLQMIVDPNVDLKVSTLHVYPSNFALWFVQLGLQALGTVT